MCSSDLVDCALMWREQAKTCNIDINVVREPDDGYWTNVWRKKPFVSAYWFGRPTIDWMMTTAFTSNAVWNDTSWSNTRFDELLALLGAEVGQHDADEQIGAPGFREQVGEHCRYEDDEKGEHERQ